MAALPPPAPPTPRPPAPPVRQAEVPQAARPPAPEIEAAAPPPPVDRVAPVPQPDPARDLPEAPAPTPSRAPDPSPTVTPQDLPEPAAPRAAAPQIVTEASQTEDRPALAPADTPRPPQRRQPEIRQAARADEDTTPDPPRPDPDPQPAPPEATEAARTEDAVAAALAEALAQPSPDPAPVPAPAAGPALTGAEQDGLRLAVSECWNFAALSSEAAKVTVVVSMDMTPDGKPVPTSLRLARHTGGSLDAANQAYETARRAILRCQGEGYPLPAEKYAQWREIEMTFNPERMRLK